MNKFKIISLTANLVLAITFTLSCEDKETKDKPAPAAAVAVPETVAAVSESDSKIMYVNDVKGLNMRSEPSTDGVKLGTLFYGTKVQVLEKSGTPVKIGEITDYWYKIDADVSLGGKVYEHSWVFGGYLSENPPKEGTFTDSRDGEVYRKVKIGTQTWMAENLTYNGSMYTLDDAKKACPAGWHLPTDKEWTTLVNYAGGEKIAGKKLKSKTGWKENGNGTDDYGFSALPGGEQEGCENGFCYSGVGDYGKWLSATEHTAARWLSDEEYDTGSNWCRRISESVDREHCNGATGEFNNGYTIRCIQN